jgi:23S rRNA (guanosine2251-2'-O)-methyltransferase
VARIAAFGYSQISDLLEEVSPPDFSGCVLALDGLTDPHNFGAILRTAEAVGVRHVVIPKDRSVDVTPVVMKTSAGAVHHLKVCKATNLRRVIVGLKQRGFWVVGLCADAPERLFDHIYPAKLCLVLGSEGGGIRPLIRRECDFQVAIPMLGRTSSLNVSVAGAVFLYEWVRQRRITAHPASVLKT